MTFNSLGLSDPLLRALDEKGYKTPTSIQTQSIPPIIAGRDVMAAAQTGTGKTAGFTLPMLHRLAKGKQVKPNSIRALVLVPTRELASQVDCSVKQYGKHLRLRSAVVFGGVKISPQMLKLRRGVDILVATPGRLLDLFSQNAIKFQQLEILVLDEADRMLDMGFIKDIQKILALLPKNRQNLMFSATFSGDIRKFTKGLLKKPVEIDVSPRNTTAVLVKQVIHPVDKSNKSRLLSHLIRQNKWSQVLVFVRTKRGADRLVTQLNKVNMNAAAIHGDKSQGARTRALADFKRGKLSILVATDIAARGIDISELPHVINYDLPDVAENYVHRIGRTGRAGADGDAISLVSADEVEVLSDIENLIGKLLAREIVDDFEPKHAVPETQLKNKKHKPKKIKTKIRSNVKVESQLKQGEFANSKKNSNSKKKVASKQKKQRKPLLKSQRKTNQKNKSK